MSSSRKGQLYVERVQDNCFFDFKGEYVDRMMFIVKGKMNVYNVRPPDQVKSLKKALRRTSTLTKDKQSQRDLLLKLGTGELTTEVCFPVQTKSPQKRSSNLEKIEEIKEDEIQVDNGEVGDLQRHDSLRELARDDKEAKISEVMLLEEFVEEGIPRLEYVGTLHTGQALGQHSMTVKKTRQVTVIACEDSHVTYLSKKAFDEYILGIEQKRIFDLVNFFYDAFNTITERRMMLDFIYLMRKEKYVINTNIFKEGDPATHIYVIRKGEISVILTQKIYLQLYIDVEVPKYDEVADSEQALIEKEIKPKLLKQSKAKHAYKRYPIQTLTKGQMFGEEVLLNFKTRFYGAAVSSDHISVYCIPREVESFKEMMKFYKQIKGFRKPLRDKARERTSFRLERVGISKQLAPKFSAITEYRREHESIKFDKKSCEYEDPFKKMDPKYELIKETSHIPKGTQFRLASNERFLKDAFKKINSPDPQADIKLTAFLANERTLMSKIMRRAMSHSKIRNETPIQTPRKKIEDFDDSGFGMNASKRVLIMLKMAESIRKNDGLKLSPRNASESLGVKDMSSQILPPELRPSTSNPIIKQNEALLEQKSYSSRMNNLLDQAFPKLESIKDKNDQNSPGAGERDLLDLKSSMPNSDYYRSKSVSRGTYGSTQSNFKNIIESERKTIPVATLSPEAKKSSKSVRKSQQILKFVIEPCSYPSSKNPVGDKRLSQTEKRRPSESLFEGSSRDDSYFESGEKSGSISTDKKLRRSKHNMFRFRSSLSNTSILPQNKQNYIYQDITRIKECIL